MKSIQKPLHLVACTFPLKVLLLTLINFLLLQNANATLFFTDHFEYTDGANLGSTTGGGATWTAVGGNVSQIKVTTASTQTSPGGYATAAGLGVAVTPTTSRKDAGTAFNGATGIPIADGNVVYASFLLNVRTLPSSTTNRFVYLHNVATSSSGATELWVSYDGKIGISKKGSTIAFVSGTPVASSGTHLVVMRYTFQSGADEVALWVDPDSGSYGVNPAPTTGTYIATTTGSDMANAILDFIIGSPAVAGPVVWIDEVRVATTWAEVTPSNGSLPPASVPVITQAFLELQGMILRGTNGPQGSVYQVIASTNLTLPVSNWPSIAAHLFDSAGNFDSTNPVTAGLDQQFFRLLVGGTIPPAPTAPVITSQPQSLTVGVGAAANFIVGATGTAPLNYFWSFNTNTPVGGNSNTLALLNVQTNAAGSFRVIVSNSLGSVTSSVATLTVLLPPTITDNPTNLTVAAGESAGFNVSATGSALHYQWYFDTDSPLANATNATLALNAVNATNAGAYSVVVTNAAGAVTSSVATLTVLGPPVITVQPQSHTVVVSNDATFTVTAAGTAPLAYQWFFNTNTPVGGNSSLFTLLNAQTNDAGTYSVIVTNDYGAVTSAFATLTVGEPTSSSRFSLMGFGEGTTGGGVIAETDPGYAKVYTPLDLANAVYSANKAKGVKVIEIMNDLDLGWNEIGSAVQNMASTPFVSAIAPKLHPKLLTTGVSVMYINPKNGGLTIFSANGASIRHCVWGVKATQTS